MDRTPHPSTPLSQALDGWPAGASLAGALNESAIISVTDRAGKIIFANDRFCSVSGYPREALLGQTHALLNSGLHDRSVFKAMYAAIARGKVWRGTLRNRRTDGSFYWVDTTIVPQAGADGKPETYVSVRFDVTAHMESQAELKASRLQAQQSAAAKDRALASLSHEFRTPLAGLIGITNMAAERALDPVQADYVHAVADACQAMDETVTDVMTLAQAESNAIVLAPRPTDLRSALENTLCRQRQKAAQKGVDFRVDVDGSVPASLLVDETRLTKAVANLAGNAIRLTVAGSVDVVASWSRDWLSVAVRDTSSGFDPTEKARLFHAFEPEAPIDEALLLGSGMGLAAAASLVRAMGGALDAESIRGQGSCFSFRIPCVAGPTAAPKNDDRHESTEFRAPSVLVVEDTVVIQTILRQILEAGGCSVDVAENGAVGVQRLRERAYDICFMDLRMPVLGGREAVAQIRHDSDLRVRSTHIVAVSAEVLEGDGYQLIDQGFDGFLPKPINPHALLAAAFSTSPRSVDRHTSPLSDIRRSA